MESNHYMFVDFTMCKTCRHYKQNENGESCCECLDQPFNLNTKRPINWEEIKRNEEK